MDAISGYYTFLLMLFLIFPMFFVCLKLIALCCYTIPQRRVPVNNLGRNARQAPIYSITTDPRGNDNPSNFTDFFWNVPTQNIRTSELAKDDKDLPSYEDVMRMEMERQVISSAIQSPITTTTTTTGNTAETVPPPPVRLPPV